VQAKALEQEIDILVYKLYNLTYDEIKIVDHEFWFNKEEYDKFKIESWNVRHIK